MQNTPIWTGWIKTLSRRVPFTIAAWIAAYPIRGEITESLVLRCCEKVQETQAFAHWSTHRWSVHEIELITGSKAAEEYAHRAILSPQGERIPLDRAVLDAVKHAEAICTIDLEVRTREGLTHLPSSAVGYSVQFILDLDSASILGELASVVLS